MSWLLGALATGAALVAPMACSSRVDVARHGSGGGANGDATDSVSGSFSAGRSAGSGGRSAGPDCAYQLASGEEHYCAVYADGSVWCWGRGTEGQLGDGRLGNSSVPVNTGLQNVKSIASGPRHTCALDDAGAVHCWGDNSAFQLGEGAAIVATPRNLMLSTGARITDLGLGARQTCVVDLFAHVYCLGTDEAGEVARQPLQVSDLLETRPLLSLGDSADVPFVLTEDGRSLPLYSWRQPFTDASYTAGVRSVSKSSSRTCIVKRTGTLYCTEDPAVRPLLRVELGETVIQAAAGAHFDCALVDDGQVLCGGANALGQLGQGARTPTSVSAPVVGLKGAVELAVTSTSGCARTADGAISCWGSLATEQTSVTPVERSGCSTSAGVPGLPSLPAVTALERYAEAGAVFGHAQCICASPGPNVDGCIEEEDRSANLTCLHALGGLQDDAELTCLTNEAWSTARCWMAGCTNDFTLPPNCRPKSSCGGASLVSICHGPLVCGEGASVRGYKLLCDGRSDCSDGFDELNCTPNQTSFHCANGKTVALAAVSDQKDDCGDGSDERY